ncbi:MAG: carboxypeptidase regulatory-like domain-containing protein, partial [Candidatus Micrarchaeota archaeon]
MPEGEQGFFEKLKEAYENFIFYLEDHGVPQPRLLVPVVGAVILIALAFFLLPGLLSPSQTVEFTVLSPQNTPVLGAAVTLTSGEYAESSYSDASGKVSFQGVPKGKDLEVQISATGYEPKSGLFENKDSISLSAKAPVQTKKSFEVVVREEGEAGWVEDAGVQLTFADTTQPMSKSTDLFGRVTFDLTGVAQTTTIVEVTKPGFESSTRVVNLNDGTVTIQLRKTGGQQTEEALKGDFLVRVQGPAAQGVVVKLVDDGTSSVFATATVDANNKAAFRNLDLDSEFYVTAIDPQDRFLNYEGEDQIFFETNLQEETIVLEQKKTPEDEMKVIVKKEDGSSLQGAEVKIYDQTTRVLYDEKSTDASGNAKFNVAGKGKKYYITAFKDGYLPNYAKNAVKGEAYTITLEKELEGNFVEANVQVYENTQPVADVEVNFFKSDGFPLGVPSVFTSSDGTALLNIPVETEDKKYRAYAVASGSDSKTGRSDLVDVNEGVSFVITIQAPPANVTLIAKDLVTNETIENAFFNVLSSANAVVKDCASPCSLMLSPEVEFKISASSKGYLQTTTTGVSFNPNERKTVEVMLYPLSLAKKNSLNFIGFYDRNGNNVAELERAETYTARFVLALSEKSDAFAFFQAGDAADLASEGIEITQFKSAVKPKNIFSGATSDTVCAPEDETQAESLKWFELDYSSQLGAVQIEVEFQTKADAPAGSEAKILYRAGGYTESGVPFTSPQDDDLLSGLLSQAVGDRLLFCSAKTNSATAKVEANPMVCKNGLCARIVLERDDGFKLRNNLPVQIGRQFYVHFDFFAPGEIIDTVSLAEDSTMEILEGRMGGLSLQDRLFTATGTDRASGTITVLAVKESKRTVLRLGVVFDSEKEPIAVERSVEITGKNQFDVSVTPQRVNVGENAKIQVIVLDSFTRPVTNAELSLLNCGDREVLSESIDKTGTNVAGAGRDGKYEFKFTPLTFGDVCLEVRGDGFEMQRVEPAVTAISTNFLTVTPEEVVFEGAADQQNAVELIANSSLEGVKIKIRADVSEECKPLISVRPGVKEKVESAAKFSLILNSFDAVEGECFVRFLGEADEHTKSAVEIPVLLNLTAPITPPPILPPCEPVNSCLTPEEAEQFGSVCAPRVGFACSEGTSCFVCGDGLGSIESVSLTVNNLHNDRQVYPLVLTFEPQFNEEYDLVWEQPFETVLPDINQAQFQIQPGYDQYYNQYYNNYPSAYSSPYSSWYGDYYGSQPYYSSSAYPYGTNYGSDYGTNQYSGGLPPVQSGVSPVPLGSTYPTDTGGYGTPSYSSSGYPSSSSSYPSYSAPYDYGYNVPSFYGSYTDVNPSGTTSVGVTSGQGGLVDQCPAGFFCQQQTAEQGLCVSTGGNPYPGIQSGQSVLPSYCNDYLYNSQSGYNNYYGANYQSNPYTPGVPYGYPANCQYPQVCVNIYSTPSGTDDNYYACAYLQLGNLNIFYEKSNT